MILRNQKTGTLVKVYCHQNSIGGRFYYLVDRRGNDLATREEALLADRGSAFQRLEVSTVEPEASLWFKCD